MLTRIITAMIVLFSLTSCLKDPKATNTCNYDPCAYKAPDSEVQAVQNYLASKGISNAVKHCSGLYYVIDDAGTGTQPGACSYVSVHYKGSLTDGTVFDERDYQFFLDQVIQGWTNGVPLIKKGGKIHLYIPPSLGYGSQSNGPIPANSILIFDISLSDVQ
jgi:FKBP-type peptidyl-prolyl cis-trans isomerase FkpA